MANPKKEIKLLVRWLKNNNKATFTGILGYNDTQIIDNWIKRNSIPPYQLERVLQIINGEGNEDDKRISSAG